jgi:hypothetical protein
LSAAGAGGRRDVIVSDVSGVLALAARGGGGLGCWDSRSGNRRRLLDGRRGRARSWRRRRRGAA